MALKLATHPEGIVLSLKVVPGARRDRIIGELGEALKIAVSKPPEDGAANAAVVKLLAEVLGIRAGSLRIIKGHTSPRKQIMIQGITQSELEQRLQAAIAQT